MPSAPTSLLNQIISCKKIPAENPLSQINGPIDRTYGMEKPSTCTIFKNSSADTFSPPCYAPPHNRDAWKCCRNSTTTRRIAIHLNTPSIGFLPSSFKTTTRSPAIRSFYSDKRKIRRPQRFVASSADERPCTKPFIVIPQIAPNTNEPSEFFASEV